MSGGQIVYMLSVDAGSILEKQYRKGLFCPPSEDELAEKYDTVVKILKKAGYEHYEISNFARKRKYSVQSGRKCADVGWFSVNRPGMTARQC